MSPASKKVVNGAHGAAASAAGMTVLLFVLAQLPIVTTWPEPVRGAVAVLLLSTASWLGTVITAHWTMKNQPPKGPAK